MAVVGDGDGDTVKITVGDPEVTALIVGTFVVGDNVCCKSPGVVAGGSVLVAACVGLSTAV